MGISLKDDWKEFPQLKKVYPLGPKDRKVVDQEFDCLHSQNKMHWTAKNTPFGYSVFVV